MSAYYTLTTAVVRFIPHQGWTWPQRNLVDGNMLARALRERREDMEAMRFRAEARRAADRQAWLDRRTRGGLIPHVEVEGVLFVPVSPNGDGTMSVKILPEHAYSSRRLDLPLNGTIEDELGRLWAQVSRHDRLRLWAAIANRTPRKKRGA